MILLIDNYDSFVHNLARYLEQLGQNTRVVRNDAMDVSSIGQLRPEAIVISPGPCTPAEAGCSIDVVRRFAGQIPILGVCLGHQAIGAALGANVVRAPAPMHGRPSPMRHSGRGLFAGLPNPLRVGRYHSLVVAEDKLPAELLVTARTDDGAVMAIEHRRWPVVGLQFHPESILTERGHDLLAAYLRVAGLKVPRDVPDLRDELSDSTKDFVHPQRPVTF